MTSILDVLPANVLVAVDSAPFIYYIEGGRPFVTAAVELFERCFDTWRNTGVTTVITLTEVVTGTHIAGRPDLAGLYRQILQRNAGLSLIPITLQVAEEAAELRARYRLRTPDALQIAGALAVGAPFLSRTMQRFAVFKRSK